MRRSGDFLLACVLLAITLPLMLIIAAAIRMESPGPILEHRSRIGAGGRQFQMLSFRTTTRLGKFLRSTRIDALPQLLNVLRGEMSLMDTALMD